VPASVQDLLFHSPGGPGPAVVDGDRAASRDELAARALALAARIRGAGVEPGDRVGIHLEKSLEAVVALWGVWTAGAIAVPIHESLRSRQVEHIVSDSDAALLVSARRKLARLDEAARAGRPVLELEPGPAPAKTPGADAAGPSGQDPAAILYTSGSTGRPKGILLSHDNLLAGTRIVSSYLGITADDRLLSVLPFSFDYGLNQLTTAAAAGATLVLQRSHLPGDICRTLCTKAVTGMAAVPPLWIQLMQPGSPLGDVALPALRYITNSGGVFPVDVLRRYRERLPDVRVFLMYGLSEAFRSTYLPPEEVDRRPTSMGRAIPETTLYVLDGEGCPCPPGVAGELVHAGPTVALGYWRNPEATAAVFRPDPLDPKAKRPVVYSGDLVKRDAEGFLTFVGRRDQMLKCSGFRVSPEEVEEIVLRSELAREVVATGEPDSVAGTGIVLHVVPAEAEAFREEALRDFCRREMPSYMIPKRIEVHESLPRTSSGKLDRKSLAR
jgi:acyl-CoA ligase (AMP-forming) (exosortase A-associated)